jgi:hypothetical protein
MTCVNQLINVVHRNGVQNFRLGKMTRNGENVHRKYIVNRHRMKHAVALTIWEEF